MFGVVDRKFARRKTDERYFLDRSRIAKLEVPVEPLVDQESTSAVIVVTELRVYRAVNFIRGAVKGIEFFELREPLGGEFHGPVLRTRHSQGLRCEQARQFDVAGSHSQQR